VGHRDVLVVPAVLRGAGDRRRDGR
jgi:hypothetical protein